MSGPHMEETELPVDEVEVEEETQWTNGCATSQARTAGVRWDDELSRMTCSSRFGYARTTFAMKARKSAAVWRALSRCVTSPVAISRAAYRSTTPWRL